MFFSKMEDFVNVVQKQNGFDFVESCEFSTLLQNGGFSTLWRNGGFYCEKIADSLGRKVSCW